MGKGKKIGQVLSLLLHNWGNPDRTWNHTFWAVPKQSSALGSSWGVGKGVFL